MVNCRLILKGCWLCVDLPPHRHPLHEVAVIAISLSLGARIRKKEGAALPRSFTSTWCKEGLDVGILDYASGFGREWWTWFFCSLPSSPGALFTPLPSVPLQLCCFLGWCVLGPRAERGATSSAQQVLTSFVVSSGSLCQPLCSSSAFLTEEGMVIADKIPFLKGELF